ncbi:MAG: type II toxin-antitoxin system HicA family toxin [Phycisphaerae bacterium]
MNRKKLLLKLSQGAVSNIAFGDIVSLAEGFWFVLSRVSGSHHIYAHPQVRELLNLQIVGGKAKPYQIRQLLRLVELYNPSLEEDE